MLFLYILLGILAFFVLIMFIPVKFGVQYKENAEIYLKVLFIKIKLSPRKKKVNIKKYSPRAMEKARRKKIKQQIKKEQKLIKKSNKKKKNTEKKVSKIKDILSHPTDLPSFITDIYDILSIVTDKFTKRLKIKILSCNVDIGSDNAAKTAILYGSVCAGINALLSALVQFTRYNEKDNENITVTPNFISEKTVCDVHLQVSLRPGQLFTFLISSIPEIFRILDYI